MKSEFKNFLNTRKKKKEIRKINRGKKIFLSNPILYGTEEGIKTRILKITSKSIFILKRTNKPNEKRNFEERNIRPIVRISGTMLRNNDHLGDDIIILQTILVNRTFPG